MLIKENDRKALADLFAKELTGPVRLVVFDDGAFGKDVHSSACQYCEQTVELMHEVAELSDHITLDVYNYHTDKEEVEAYGITRIPAIAVVGAKDYGVRYYGIPAGYEFTSLIEDMIDVSRGTTDLSPASRELISRIDSPVHIQVFVTPTCPYCPSAVRLAHKLAIESEFVVADMVEAQEFPELAQAYDVYGVPRTVINEKYHFEGSLPEDMVVRNVLYAVGKLSEQEAAEAGLTVG